MVEVDCFRCRHTMGPDVRVCSECGLPAADGERMAKATHHRRLAVIEFLLRATAVCSWVAAIEHLMQVALGSGTLWQAQRFPRSGDVLATLIESLYGLWSWATSPLAGGWRLGWIATLLFVARLDRRRPMRGLVVLVILLAITAPLSVRPIDRWLPAGANSVGMVLELAGAVAAVHAVARHLGLRLPHAIRWAWIGTGLWTLMVLVLTVESSSGTMQESTRTILGFAEATVWGIALGGAAASLWSLAHVLHGRSLDPPLDAP